MKIRNPFYLSFALATLVFVGAANRQGWSLLQAIAARTWQHSEPNTQHK